MMNKTKGKQSPFLYGNRKISWKKLLMVLLLGMFFALLNFGAQTTNTQASTTFSEGTSSPGISPKGCFSATLPVGWEKDDKGLVGGKTCGLRLYAPQTAYPNHVFLELACHTERHKTAERWIHDLLNSSPSPGGGSQSEVRRRVVDGRNAYGFVKKVTRWPIAGLAAEKTEALEKYVVVPRQSGFCVLMLSAPADIFDQYGPVFDSVLASWKLPGKETKGKTDDITDEEYRVYTDFFYAKREPDWSSPVSDLFPSQGRLVYELTSTAKKMTAAEKQSIKKILDGEDVSILQDYLKKNRKEYCLKDKIMADGIMIFTQQELSEANREGLKNFPEALQKKYPLQGDLVYLSRVGFNRKKDKAFFHAAISNGFMGAGYYVVMQKKDATWRLKNTLLENFWHY